MTFLINVGLIFLSSRDSVSGEELRALMLRQEAMTSSLYKMYSSAGSSQDFATRMEGKSESPLSRAVQIDLPMHG